MESTDLDMDEIFDDNDIDHDMGATGVLPDLPEATQTQNEDEENAEVLARLKDLSKGAAKKVVRKPQPKLDPSRLTGERGIPILPNQFKDVKFKGKGHEAQDLATLMQQMEHWAHRLFPKMPFDEVIERVEKLGNKKEVQTCIKKIRLDMPILDADFVGSDHEDDDVIRRGEDDAGKQEVRADDMWDELLREEAEMTSSQIQSDSNVEPGTSSDVGAPSSTSGDTEIMFATPVARIQKETDSSGGFTPEQLERIEKNKQLAQERRLKKIGRLTPGSKAHTHSQTPGETETTDSQAPSQQTVKLGSHAVNEGDSQTVEGNNQTLKSVDEGNIQTQNTVSESESGIHGIDKQNSEKLEEMDTYMSEVLEKGPSQNIIVSDYPQENAQNWHTGPAVGKDTGLTFGSGSSEGTESVDAERSTVVGKENTSKDMLEIQDLRKDNSNSSVKDSQEMSEIIEKQSDVKVILKEKPDNLNSKYIGDEVTSDIEVSKLPNAKLETNSNHDKENIQKMGEENVGKEIKKVDQTNDKGNCEANVEDFDDELTEDQLMDTLES